jgi:hypothetical protein
VTFPSYWSATEKLPSSAACTANAPASKASRWSVALQIPAWLRGRHPSGKGIEVVTDFLKARRAGRSASPSTRRRAAHRRRCGQYGLVGDGGRRIGGGFGGG